MKTSLVATESTHVSCSHAHFTVSIVHAFVFHWNSFFDTAAKETLERLGWFFFWKFCCILSTEIKTYFAALASDSTEVDTGWWCIADSARESLEKFSYSWTIRIILKIVQLKKLKNKSVQLKRLTIYGHANLFAFLETTILALGARRTLNYTIFVSHTFVFRVFAINAS